MRYVHSTPINIEIVVGYTGEEGDKKIRDSRIIYKC